MKTLTTLIGTLAPVTAFAAATKLVENDGLFVWIFLGFLAVIVVGQLIPALMLVIGMVKGFTTHTEVKAEGR